MRNLESNKLLFELSRIGRRATRMPDCDVPERPLDELIPPGFRSESAPALPEVSEPDVVRHFVNLSTQNMSVDTHFYPLGSCTMKHNAKRNERIAAMPGMGDVHPLQPEESIQGLLQLLYEVQEMLAEISGLPAVSLQPAAGAHGELTALMTAAAYFRDLGQHRTKVFTPDSAHGTNPASARMVGFDTVTIKSTEKGFVDTEALRSQLDESTAVFMITNPNTLGMFEPQVAEIADMVHKVGGLIYLDGANMNAILGITRPGDFGADMMHFNPHKTFSGPHGGGGPGAGPICVTDKLGPYLPKPIVVKDGDKYRLDDDRPLSIGRVRSFFGNVGVLVRAYAYLRTHGPDGLKRVSENAVLNANYLLSRVKHILPVPHGDRCMHEFVATCLEVEKGKRDHGDGLGETPVGFRVSRTDRLFPHDRSRSDDDGAHGDEKKETLDAFAEQLFRITDESPELLHEAPHGTTISRPDEVRAARQPVVKWEPSN